MAKGGKQVFNTLSRFRRAGGTVAEVGQEAHVVGYILLQPMAREVPAHIRGAVVAHSVGYAYDYFSESSASSSSSYQQNGGAGGTSLGNPWSSHGTPYVPSTSQRKIAKMKSSSRHRVCRDGFVMRKVGGRYMCVPRSSHKRSKTRRY